MKLKIEIKPIVIDRKVLVGTQRIAIVKETHVDGFLYPWAIDGLLDWKPPHDSFTLSSSQGQVLVTLAWIPGRALEVSFNILPQKKKSFICESIELLLYFGYYTAHFLQNVAIKGLWNVQNVYALYAWNVYLLFIQLTIGTIFK